MPTIIPTFNTTIARTRNHSVVASKLKQLYHFSFVDSIEKTRLLRAMRATVFTFVILALSVPCYSRKRLQSRFTDEETPAQTTTQSSNGSCICVPYYNCNSENIVITNGEGLIDVRQNFSDDDDDGERTCEDYLHVCCKLSEPQAEVRQCARRRNRDNPPFIPRLDKEEAEQGEFPWMVTIFRTRMVQRRNETIEMKVYQCQGTLIHEGVVLTAAQCVWSSGNESEPLSIRAGQFDTMTTQTELPYQERDVREVLIHPRFKPNNLRNNVALLILERLVEIDDYVDIACLVDHSELFDGDKCMTIGWDKFLRPEDLFLQKSQSNGLKKRVEPYVSTGECNRVLRQTVLGTKFNVHKSSACAQPPPRKNFCSREIGFPLMCPLRSDPNQYVQVGIHSWCISFGNLQLPSVFARLLQGRRWITTAMAKAGIRKIPQQARNSLSN